MAVSDLASKRELETAHAMGATDVCAALDSDGELGLSPEDALARLERAGPNRLPEPPRLTRLALITRQLTSPMVGLLALAALISTLTGDAIDAVVIAAIVAVNGTIGYAQESRAETAMLSLRRVLAPTARVVRAGVVTPIEAEQLVPGDIVVLRAGDRVPADGRIVQANDLEIDESSLTGESLPDSKRAEPPDAPDTPLADRATMGFAATTITRGAGRLAIIDTGSRTEVGRAMAAAARTRPPALPLQQRFDRLTAGLLRAIGALCVFLAALAWAHGEELFDALRTGVALAVAAIPEGLPVVLTVALAIGVQRMAQRNAIVRRLPAVEALGSTTVICTDKTGTLTEGRMRLGRIAACGQPELELDRGEPGPAELELLGAAGVACQQEPGAIAVPDPAILPPTEAAIAAAARDHPPLGTQPVAAGLRVVSVEPFDSARKRMSVVVEALDGSRIAYVKGAPESVLPRLASDEATRAALARRASAWAAEGMRVLLVARRPLADDDDPETGLAPLGLLGLLDPVRPEVAASVAAARGAGVRTVLVTGDHPGTAQSVALAVGIVDGNAGEVVTGATLDAIGDAEIEACVRSTSVFARVAPEHKVRIVAALQRNGEVVAMTGDGVNDVPALEAAHVGVAMGRRGTDAAREAADLVLTDDDYSTIVAAIRRGRSIYDNVVHFVHFLLAANAGEVLVFTIAIAIGLPPPLTVIQILLVNLLTDGPPAVAIGVDPPRSGLMRRAPRPVTETVLDPIRTELLIGGLAIGLVAFAAFLIGHAESDASAQTMAFATLVAAQLAYLFAVRADGWPPTAGRNVFLYVAVAGAAGFAFVLLVASPVRETLGLVTLGAGRIVAIVVLAAIPYAILVAVKARRARRRRVA